MQIQRGKISDVFSYTCSLLKELNNAFNPNSVETFSTCGCSVLNMLHAALSVLMYTFYANTAGI